MHKIHHITGVILTLSVGLHLLNHTYAVLGAQQHIKFMQTLRLFYRNIFIETLLLFAVAVQITTDLRLFGNARKNANTLFKRLHIYTGLYLSVFFIVHIGAVMIGRVFLHLDTNFYFGVAGLNVFPLNLLFIPYYGLAILSFFGHIAFIHYKKMKLTIVGISPGKQSIAKLVIGFVLTIVIFYGLTNRFNGVPIPNEYNILLSK